MRDVLIIGVWAPDVALLSRNRPYELLNGLRKEVSILGSLNLWYVSHPNMTEGMLPSA